MRLLRSTLLICLVSGCGALPFDLEEEIPEQMVPGNTNPLAQLFPSLFSFPVTVDIQTETARRSSGPARSANLKSFTLAATPHAAPSGNFDFLDEVHIFVEPTDGGSLPRREVATLSPVPRGATSVSFTVDSSVDLLPYFNAGAKITASASGRQPLADFTFDGQLVVTVHI